MTGKEFFTSIIVPVYNGLVYTKIFFRSILENLNNSYGCEIIIINNNSIDGTKEWLEKFREKYVRYLNKKNCNLVIQNKNKNLGAAGGWNAGLKIAKGDYLICLNNDIVVTYNWIKNLVDCADSDKKIGMVGCITWLKPYPKSIKESWYVKDKKGPKNYIEVQKIGFYNNNLNKDKFREVNVVHGMCMLIKREVLDKVGYFDEQFYPLGGEDIDYCLRVRQAGYKIVVAEDVFIYHFGHVANFSLKIPLNKIRELTSKRLSDKWSRIYNINFDISI